MQTDANSTEQAFDSAASVDANSQEAQAQGTQGTDTQQSQSGDAAHQIDYKEKFSASSREAQRLLDEKKALEAENARLKAEREGQSTIEQGTDSNEMFPGFEQLDEEAKRNLLEYTKAVETKVRDGLYKDPAISHSIRVYNESRFDKAFDEVAAQYPELKEAQADFKSKYFQPNNTPDNIGDILKDLSKVYLFDKAKEMGAAEEKARQDRIDMERSKGGNTGQTTTHRTLEEWHRLQQENPAKFASLSKEYHADLESGALGE